MQETSETRKNGLMQWVNREFSIINIITIISIPVSIGFGINEYRTFKSTTEARVKALEDKADKVKDDITEIKYNVRDTAKDTAAIKESVSEIKKSVTAIDKVIR